MCIENMCAMSRHCSSWAEAALTENTRSCSCGASKDLCEHLLGRATRHWVDGAICCTATQQSRLVCTHSGRDHMRCHGCTSLICESAHMHIPMYAVRFRNAQPFLGTFSRRECTFRAVKLTVSTSANCKSGLKGTCMHHKTRQCLGLSACGQFLHRCVGSGRSRSAHRSKVTNAS